MGNKIILSADSTCDLGEELERATKLITPAAYCFRRQAIQGRD